MATYRDFIFKQGDYVKLKEITDSEAVVMAIKNIMLSRPGNFPLSPNIGMNIQKYQFDILDDQQVATIRSELLNQVSLLIPDMTGIEIVLELVKDDTGAMPTSLGVYVMSKYQGENVGTGFLMYKEHGDIQIIDTV